MKRWIDFGLGTSWMAFEIEQSYLSASALRFIGEARMNTIKELLKELSEGKAKGIVIQTPFGSKTIPVSTTKLSSLTTGKPTANFKKSKTSPKSKASAKKHLKTLKTKSLCLFKPFFRKVVRTRLVQTILFLKRYSL